MKIESFADYDEFAWLYQREWAGFSRRLLPALRSTVLNRLPPGSKILDLCCGTGQLAQILSEEGYEVTGLDASAPMLELARRNAPKANFLLADARSFRLPPSFAAVFSTFDSLNHVMTLRELKAVFRRVANCLIEDGMFSFDLNTLRAYLHDWKSYLAVVEKPGYFYVNRADFDVRKGKGYTWCTSFRCEGAGWSRIEIRLEERYHPVPAVEHALGEAGFTGVHKYALDPALSPHKYSDLAGRVLFIASKSRALR
jgi:SAM-dependent methyltransferase